jgi:hypothetical protein
VRRFPRGAPGEYFSSSHETATEEGRGRVVNLDEVPEFAGATLLSLALLNGQLNLRR